MPDGRLTDDAVAAWRELGGPVAVKRTGVIHKARAGGVALNLDDEASDPGRAGTGSGAACWSSGWRRPASSYSWPSSATGSCPCSSSACGGVDRGARRRGRAPAARDRRESRRAAAARGLAETACAPPRLAHRADPDDFVLVELNPVIVHAHGAVAVDALADEEVLR